VAKQSAGLLCWRHSPSGTQVLLVHPGGPLWQRKDVGAWSIPKGEHSPGEDPLAAARREFAEELGLAPPDSPAVDLGQVTQAGGKTVRAWAVAGDLDVSALRSNSFEMEWPPRSGHRRRFPEIDRAAWFSLEEARTKLVAAQAAFLDRLQALLGEPDSS
jgi:predicted NUDIX family NTP pyrophosphohydrolase